MGEPCCRAFEEIREKAIREYIKEQICKKLKRGFTPEEIHEYDEYPMDLILEVRAEIIRQKRSELGIVEWEFRKEFGYLFGIADPQYIENLRRDFEKGFKKGMDHVNKLGEYLIDNGRYDDYRRALKDPSYFKQLMAECFPENENTQNP